MARRPHARILADFCQVQKILVTKKQMLARQRLSVQLALHQRRIFRQGFSANLAGAENQLMPAQKMCGECGGSGDFFPKEKMGVDLKYTNHAEHV